MENRDVSAETSKRPVGGQLPRFRGNVTCEE
jgi:hypothetical protein